ncbi:MAG: alpha/beta hydrolase [Firmicutes bacterium]|nr:alpha/beta hydrolase [Bacillota bacterium]
MKSIKLTTFDNKEMNVSVWDEVKEKKGAVCISHGMAEHSERYDRFALFLNAQGYAVLADDHRGHKYNCEGEKGKVCGDSFMQTVEDLKTVVEYAKETYGFKPIIIGHSYGSFVSQRFLELYSDKADRAILSGTAYMKTGLLKVGKFIANAQATCVGTDKTGKMINKMSFGAYNKPFASQGQEFAWLSRDKEEVAKYESDEFCGYALTIGFYKSFFNGVTAMYGADADNIPKDFKILIAVGSHDPVSNNAKLAKRLYDFYLAKGLTAVGYKVYDGARHEILNEINREEVFKDFLAFIEK